MIKHRQIYANQTNRKKVLGDCWRASIACILDLPVEEVPHPFIDGIIEAPAAQKIIDTYLLSRGLQQAIIPIGSTYESFAKLYLSNITYILLGESSSATKDNPINHCVIMKGINFIHSTSSSSVVGPDRKSGQYWAILLVQAELPESIKNHPCYNLVTHKYIHDFVGIDNSFDQEYGVESFRYEKCTRCGLVQEYID